MLTVNLQQDLGTETKSAVLDEDDAPYDGIP